MVSNILLFFYYVIVNILMVVLDIDLVGFSLLIGLLFKLGWLVDLSDLLLAWNEKFELQRKVLLRVQSVAKVDPSDPTIGMDGESQGLHIVRPISSSGEVGKIELDLVPAFVQFHRHCTDEWLYLGIGLVVGSPEPSLDSLIIQNLDFETELLFQIFDNHDQEGQLDTEGLFLINWGRYESSTDIGTDDLQDRRIDVIVSQSFDISVLDLLFPNLQWLGTNRV
jgi:hypothetical protein